jgi:4-hydroxy-tetrahydrodipicolinate synthase
LAESIEQAKLYADYGVDAVVAHLPFYYPLSADQMLQYFAQLADGIPCPLVLYNIPITTKQSIPVGVIDQLSRHPNIAGIKDSERGLERLDQSAELWADRTDFVYLMGCAAQSAIALQKGADGIVPSFGNVAPGLFKRLFEASLQGDYKTSDKLQAQADTISEIYQKDKNLSQSISALKIMMSALGLCQPYVMPPLECLDADEQKQIKEKTMAAKRMFPEFLSI